jgi:DNA-binding Lrp family transcriptional regulator
LAGKRTRDTERKLLAELLKNSKKSDRELARVLGVSQPTVSRTRAKLEKDGVIQEYTIVPDVTKLGFELMAITTGRYVVPRTKEIMAKAVAYMKKFPNILFSSRAQGMGKDAVIISLHENFTDYENFMTTLKTDWGEIVGEQESILISLKGFVAKPFSLKYLAERINPSRK